MGKLFDNHNHSQFSFDGREASVELAAARAYEAGLAGICFTDHCDFHMPPVKEKILHHTDVLFDIEAQQAEIDRVSEFSKVKIFKGVEVGMIEFGRKGIRELLDNHSFDEVIASVHFLDDVDPFYGDYYIGKDWKYAYGHYLETIYKELVWLGDFDIMGHFDYVTRYAPYPQASIFYKDFPDVLDALLKYLAENGKALEINTKTYQDYNGRRPVLDRDILLRFKELGGEAISLGSDSHSPGRIGLDFPRFAEFVRSCGFKYLAHFENRRLVQEES